MAHAKACLLCVIVLSCSRERSAPGRATGAPAAAATTLSRTFAPELVGDIAPGTPRPGDYLMALTMTFDTYPSMEMHISQRRTSAMRMTLAEDGAAHACLGAHDREATQGQYHYEPPERRRHHEREDVRLLALAGRWQVVDGVATIRFDRLSWSTCDAGDAAKLERPVTELRCIAVGPTGRVPAGSLACEASGPSLLLDLGMPMTSASRKATGSPMHAAPAGRNLMLAAPGLLVEVRQDSRATIPSITFKSGVATFSEGDYRKGRPPSFPAPRGGSAPALSPVEDACTTDSDCAVVAFEVSGAQTCCPSCATTGVTRTWAARAERVCKALVLSAPCVPLACPMGPTKPRCSAARHCTAVP